MIVVNADDFGRSESINEAIVYAFEKGIINRTTLMVNMPYVRDALEKAEIKGFFNSVGLHLNLDDGYPLTQRITTCPIFCNEDGSFNGVFRKNLTKEIKLSKIEQKCCEEEIRAQMQRYLDLGLKLMHVDSHHHIHTIPSLLPITVKLAKEYGFKSMRIKFNLHDTSIIKKYLTRLINKYITRNFSTESFFCDSQFYINNRPRIESLEIMCHPDIINNQLVDVIGKREQKQYEDLMKLNALT